MPLRTIVVGHALGHEFNQGARNNQFKQNVLVKLTKLLPYHRGVIRLVDNFYAINVDNSDVGITASFQFLIHKQYN